MKPAALMLFLLCGITTTALAQLSFLPQLGFENSKTLMQVDNGSSFSPAGINANFRANLRIDYKFKQGFGPYVSIGTAPGTIAYSFSEAANNFKAVTNSQQLRLEGGYQYTSKPIQFKKPSKQETTKTTTQYTEVRRKCGSYYYYHKQSTATAKQKQNNSLALRLQPSVGLAFLPSAQSNLKMDGSDYVYNAGNYKTALVSGMGFEFDKGKQRLFTLSVFYSRGLGSLKEEVPPYANDKIGNTLLNSSGSSWGMTVGVPFSFAKAKKIAAIPQRTKTYQHRSEYRYRCGSYQGRCTRRI
jgi:hypothetical protein